MQDIKTEQHLEDDILAHFEDVTATEPGQYAAINWGALVEKVREAVKVVGPIVQTLTPDQYKAVVALIISLVGGKADPSAA